MTTPPPGWYPDPAGGTDKRYWDGSAWHTEIPAAPTPTAKKPNKFVLPVVAIAVILGLVYAAESSCSSGDKDSSTASSTSASSGSKATSSRPSPSSGAQSKEDTYIATLEKWAKRDGYPIGDRNLMLQAGHEVCTLLDQGTEPDVISASARVMDKYHLLGKQASSVGVAASEFLCPAHNPLNQRSSTPSSTVTPQSGPLEGAHSPLMGVDLPPGSDGVFIVNDFNKDGKPNRMEMWQVPLSYDATIAAMKNTLHPYTSTFDGIPWLEGDTQGTAAGSDRYVDWWWGRDYKPLILVRVQEFEGEPTTTVNFERRD